MSKKKKIQLSTASSSGKKKTEVSSFSTFLNSNGFYLMTAGIIILAVTVVRWRWVSMPLERDEGEYAYFGHLILNGVAPYQEAYNMKLPGIYYMYALLMAVFGETYKAIHIGCSLMNAGTMILLFYSMRNFFNPMIGVLTAGLYGLMAMSSNVLGFAAHATHFAVFYVALALFFFSKYEALQNRSVSPPTGGAGRGLLFALLAGIMFGMAFLMKQQAVYFILFGGAVFLVFRFLEKPRNLQSIVINTGLFSIGVFIPYILVLLIMLATGTFDKFWFWTVQYASKYASGLPWESGKELLGMTFSPIWNEHKWIYYLAIAGVIVVLFAKFSIKQKIFAIALVVFGCLATTPGFYFRQHYFIVALPGVALLSALALEYVFRFVKEKIKLNAIALAIPLAILFYLFSSTFSSGKWYYSPQDPVMLCKMIYGVNPFIESVEIAKYIEANSSDTDKVAILGSEPQIPFYANRKSASGHIYTYGLMEIHEYNLKMQEEMIAEIEKEKPLFFIYVNVGFSWLTKPDSPKKIMEWAQKYSAENYNLVGLIDMPDRALASYYWNADANRQPKNQNSVWIFKRKKK